MKFMKQAFLMTGMDINWGPVVRGPLISGQASKFWETMPFSQCKNYMDGSPGP